MMLVFLVGAATMASAGPGSGAVRAVLLEPGGDGYHKPSPRPYGSRTRTPSPSVSTSTSTSPSESENGNGGDDEHDRLADTGDSTSGIVRLGLASVVVGGLLLLALRRMVRRDER